MNHRSKVADSHYFLRRVVAELLAGYSNVSSTLSSRALSQSISFSHSYWRNIFILIAASAIIPSDHTSMPRWSKLFALFLLVQEFQSFLLRLIVCWYLYSNKTQVPWQTILLLCVPVWFGHWFPCELVCLLLWWDL